MKLKPFKILFLSVLMLTSCGKDTDQLEETPKINVLVDFGDISEPLFEKNGDFTIGRVNNTSQLFKFTIDGYSKFDIAINDFTGEFWLKNLTENSFITNNGGVLGGGSPVLEFEESFEYETELYEGEYEIRIGRGILTKDDTEGTYDIAIKNIDDLRPVKDLGVLTLPYNELHAPYYERARHTIYEFEISEPTGCHIFINGDHPLDPSPTKHYVKLIDETGNELYRYLQDRLLNLEKGKFTLHFNRDVVLILGNPLEGDIDLGLISTFPLSQEVNLDFTYESDAIQRTYFETDTNVALTVNFAENDGLLTNLQTINGVNADYNNIPPGEYFLYAAPDTFAYMVDGDPYKTVYKPLQATFTLNFTEN